MSQQIDATASQPVTKKSCQFCGFERNNADLLNAAFDLYSAAVGVQVKIREVLNPSLDPRDIEVFADLWRAIDKAEGRS